MLALGVDLGSGGLRAVVYDSGGARVAAASSTWTLSPLKMGSEAYDLDAAYLLETAVNCVRRAIERYGGPPEDIGALSFTGFRDGMVGIDSARNPVWAYSNIDRRRPSAWDLHAATEIHARKLSGHRHPGSVAGHLAWLREKDPLTWLKIDRVLPVHDWLACSFGGDLATTPSSAGSFGTYDVRAREWSDSVAAEVGMPTTYLPEVVQPFTSTGRVGPSAAATSGLAAGTEIIAAGADIHAALLGLGALRSGDLALLGGSFWQTVLVDASPDRGYPNTRVSEHLSRDNWIYELSSSTVGLSCLSIMRAFFAGSPWREDEVRVAIEYVAQQIQAQGTHAYIEDGRLRVNQQLPIAPVTSRDIGLIMIGALLTCGVRSVVENVWSFIQHSDTPITRLLVGGGVIRSAAVCQLLGRSTPIPLRVAHEADSSARGAAMCAFLGLGVFPSVAAAAESMVASDD